MGRIARKRFSEDLREALKQSPQAGLSLELSLEVSVGIVIQVMTAIGEGRLKDGDRTEAVRCILTAIGVGKRDAASICASAFRHSESAASVNDRTDGPGRRPRRPIWIAFLLVRAAWVCRNFASRFCEDLGPLLAEIETAVRAHDARADAVPGLEVLRLAALRFEEQLPELPLGKQLYDAADRRGRHAQSAAAGRAGEKHVARRYIGEGR